ncbi:hypothetical protein BH23CHL5_BH23CHL5_17560 [soil metagenome]
MTPPTTDSHMYQTMMRQPDEIARLIRHEWEQADAAASMLAGVDRATLVGIGTSYHAAMVASWLLNAAGLPSRAVSSFDFATYPEFFPVRASDAVIILAHTGVKSYSRLSLERAVELGATVLSVGSTTAEHPGSQLILRTVEREKSAAYTASHLAAMTVLAQVSSRLGEHHAESQTSEFRTTLEALPAQLESVLNRGSELESIAMYASEQRVYAAGAGPNEATVLELVIKAREAAYGHVDALAAEQFLHGPMVAVNEGDVAMMVHVSGTGADRVGQIAHVLEGIGARLLVVGSPVDLVSEATTFLLPELPELLSPLLVVVPMQMLAYQMAAVKSINPDTFRRDDERYKMAFGRLVL